MNNITVISQTQRIVLDPATSSVSVINTGPPGPPGMTGPSEAATILTVDGQLLTRTGGILAPITRANLVADSAFTSVYPRVVNHGSTAGTARTGTAPIFWIGSVDPTNATDDDELFRTDTVVLSKRIAGVWVVVSGSVYVGPSAPPAPTNGKLWLDDDDASIIPSTISPTTLVATSEFETAFLADAGITAALAARYAAIAQGRIYTGPLIDTPTVGTTPLFVGTTSSIPMLSTRKYGVYMYTALSWQNVLADSHQMHIQMDSADMTEPGGSHMFYCVSAGNYHNPGVVYAAISAPSSGNHVFRVRVTRIAGTGVMQVRGHLVVMDEGAI